MGESVCPSWGQGWPCTWLGATDGSDWLLWWCLSSLFVSSGLQLCRGWSCRGWEGGWGSGLFPHSGPGIYSDVTTPPGSSHGSARPSRQPWINRWWKLTDDRPHFWGYLWRKHNQGHADWTWPQVHLPAYHLDSLPLHRQCDCTLSVPLCPPQVETGTCVPPPCAPHQRHPGGIRTTWEADSLNKQGVYLSSHY